MTVSDIERIDAREERRKFLYRLGAVNDPDRLGDAVGDKIVDRLMLRLPRLDDIADRGVVSVGQENRSCVRVAIIDMIYSVLLLVGAGQLMFLYDIVHIVVYRHAADETRLASAVHYLTVYVHAIRLVLLADTVGFELFEILRRLVVDSFGIELRADGQIDLRLVDMEERIGIALYHLAGFVAVHNIIGKGRDTRRIFGDGSYCFEGSEYCHNETSFLELNYILPVFLPPSFMPESTLVSNE